jgi:hypothetical protein
MGTALKVSVQKAEAVLQWAGELSGHLHQMTASYWPARIKEHLPADLMEKVKGLVPLAEQVVSLCKEEITKHAQDATKTAGKAIGDLRNSYTTPDVHARALVSLREVRASVKTAEASGQKHYAEALEEIEKGWNTALVDAWVKRGSVPVRKRGWIQLAKVCLLSTGSPTKSGTRSASGWMPWRPQ